ncbi:MAG: hypothetical protein AB7I18_08865 [Candidatus Berkiella sp.]
MIDFTQAFYHKATTVTKRLLNNMTPEEKANTVSIWEKEGVMPPDFLTAVKSELKIELESLHNSLEADVVALQSPEKIKELNDTLQALELTDIHSDHVINELKKHTLFNFNKRVEDSRQKVIQFDKSMDDCIEQLSYLPIPK